MISRTEVEKLPSSLREGLTAAILQAMEKAERGKRSAAESYVLTKDEKHRAAALLSQGEYNAFSVLYNIFK